MIELKNVCFKYPNNEDFILQDVNLNFNSHGFYLISGAVGSGKSTLLKLILGQIRPQKGDILIDDISYNKIDAMKLIEHKIAYIAQETTLFDDLTCLNNLLIIEEDLKKIDDVLIKVNLINKKKTKVKKLSQGERQRLCIARALLLNKEIILCDEITSALDKKNRNNILSLLKELSKCKLVLAISHQTKIYLPFCDVHLVLQNGNFTNEILNEIKDIKSSNNIKDIRIQEDKLVLPYAHKLILKGASFGLLILVAYILIVFIWFYWGQNSSTTYLADEYAYNQVVFNGSKSALSQEALNATYIDNIYYFEERTFKNNNSDIFYFNEEIEAKLVGQSIRINPIKESQIIYGRNREKKNEVTIGIPKWFEKKLWGSFIDTYVVLNEEKFYITGVYQSSRSSLELNIEINDDLQVYFSSYNNFNFYNEFIDEVAIRLQDIHEDMILPYRMSKLYFKISNQLKCISLANMQIRVDNNRPFTDIIIKKDTYKEIIQENINYSTAFYNQIDDLKTDLQNSNKLIYPYLFMESTSKGFDSAFSKTNMTLLVIFGVDIIIGVLYFVFVFKDKKFYRQLKELKDVLNKNIKNVNVKRNIIIEMSMLIIFLIGVLITQIKLLLPFTDVILFSIICLLNYAIIKSIYSNLYWRKIYDNRI